MEDTSNHPGDPDPSRSGPRVTRDEMTDVRRLRRPHDRMVAGVAAGVARHFDVDPLVVRVAFAVLVLFGGAGLLLYGALWLLLPDDGAEQAPVPLDERSRTVALVGVVVVAGLALLGDTAGLYWFPWPLLLVGLVVWFFWDRSQKQAQTNQATQAYETQAPTSQAPTPQAYTPQAHTPQAYGPLPPPPGHAPPPPAPVSGPRDTRRRGPILFGFTLALVALAIGVLATVDLAGVAVVDSAYPALALAVVSVMLIVGSFWGRAGGLILLALIAFFTTLGAMVNEGWEHEQASHAPIVASQVRDHYDMRTGELVLDLREVTDLDALDSRLVSVEIGVGRLEVIAPAEVTLDVEADVGIGSLQLPDGEQHGGLGISHTWPAEDRDAPTLRLDLDAGIGEIVVRQAPASDNQASDDETTDEGTDDEEVRP